MQTWGGRHGIRFLGSQTRKAVLFKHNNYGLLSLTVLTTMVTNMISNKIGSVQTMDWTTEVEYWTRMTFDSASVQAVVYIYCPCNLNDVTGALKCINTNLAFNPREAFKIPVELFGCLACTPNSLASTTINANPVRDHYHASIYTQFYVHVLWPFHTHTHTHMCVCVHVARAVFV